MLSNMASSLFIHKRIRTTEAKAKALRRYVEPLLTKSKNDTTHSRRIVFSYLQHKDAVKTLFTEIAPQIMDRPGGYTRILKLGRRQGDGAEMVLIELVDFNEFLEGKPLAKTASKRRPKKKVEAKAPQAKTEVTQTVEPEAAAIAEPLAETAHVAEAAAEVSAEATEAPTEVSPSSDANAEDAPQS
jgi:large subunit ribosomal protein L17